MNEILNFHIKNKFFIGIEKIDEINAIKLSLPECKLYENLTVPESTKTYESDYDRLNIYKNGKKIETFHIHEHAHRALTALDIKQTCVKYKISRDLLLLVNNEENSKLKFDEFFNIKMTNKEKVIYNILRKKNHNQNYEYLVAKYKLDKEMQLLHEIVEMKGI